MQISRHLLLACAVATYLTPAALRAYDNESQIRARQALEEKMNQMNTPAAQTNSSAPAPAQPAKKKAAPAKQSPAQPTPALKPVPAVTTNPQTEQKLQDALDEKMNQTPPAQAAPSAPAAASTTNSEPPPAPKKKKVHAHKAAPAPAAPVQAHTAPENPRVQSPPAAAPEVSQPATPMANPPTMTTDTETQERLQQALHERMEETKSSTAPAAPVAPAAPTRPAAPATPAYAPINTPAPAAPTEQAQQPPAAQPRPAPAQGNNFAPIAPSTQNPDNERMQQALRQKMNQTPAPAPTTPRGGNNMTPQPAANLPALQGPPTGLSPEKQQKLDEILQLYKADQLTPEQYHEKRAKILEEK